MAAREGRPRGAQGPGSEAPGEAVVPALFLVDDSALQRVNQPAVATALKELSELGRFATCVPLQLEAGFSATNLRSYDELMGRGFSGWTVLPPAGEVGTIALDLQRRLFAAGQGRSAGAFDILIAATALAASLAGNATAVVHYDRDFDSLRAVEPRLLTRWVVPRGSIA